MNALPDPSLNIVLTGFMGTGKSSVGRAVAARLGRPFVDMDVEIEARAGKTLSAIFAEEGEPAFRQMEADLCRELSARQASAPAPVIATGGGALVNDLYGAQNRRRMMAPGPVFCLTADIDTILQRLAQAEDRPLLDVDDRRTEAEDLLARRHEAYAALPRQIDTTDRSLEQIVDRVIDAARSILLPVNTPNGP